MEARIKQALFSAVLAAAIIAGAAMTPAAADELSKDRAVTSGKTDQKDQPKSSRLKKNKTSAPTVKNDTIQDDPYTSSREQMIKSAM